MRSLRKSAEQVATGRYDIDRVREAINQLGESEDTRAYPILETPVGGGACEPYSLPSWERWGNLRTLAGTLFLLRLLKNPDFRDTLGGRCRVWRFTRDARVVSLYWSSFGQSHPELKYAVGDSLLEMRGRRHRSS